MNTDSTFSDSSRQFGATATVDPCALPYSTGYPNYFSARIDKKEIPSSSREDAGTSLSTQRADSSTADYECSVRTVHELWQAFNAAREEHFEDGMTSEFSKTLSMIIRRDGDQGIKALCGLILSKSTNAETAGEALRWLGLIEDPKSLTYRFWLLSYALNSSSLKVRDGALLGLSFLNIPEAIPAIEGAQMREPSLNLKADMNDVLMILKAKKSAITSESNP